MKQGTIKTIFIFGALSVVVLLLFELQKWSLFALGMSNQLYYIISGIFFLILGGLISRYFIIKSSKGKQKLRKSSLSDQELRVLHLMADGLSNKEISELLFIAESTVKSHVSKILFKLKAKRRTEAIKIGRDLEIIER